MSDIQVNEPNPWKDFQDPIYTSEELAQPENIAKVAGMSGVDPTLPVNFQNISAEEMAERAAKASKKESDLSSSDRDMIAEYRYRTSGEFKRRYW